MSISNKATPMPTAQLPVQAQSGIYPSATSKKAHKFSKVQIEFLKSVKLTPALLKVLSQAGLVSTDNSVRMQSWNWSLYDLFGCKIQNQYGTDIPIHDQVEKFRFTSKEDGQFKLVMFSGIMIRVREKTMTVRYPTAWSPIFGSSEPKEEKNIVHTFDRATGRPVRTVDINRVVNYAPIDLPFPVFGSYGLQSETIVNDRFVSRDGVGLSTFGQSDTEEINQFVLSLSEPDRRIRVMRDKNGQTETVEHTHAMSSVTTYYDKSGRIMRTSSLGGVMVYTYNDKNRLIEIKTIGVTENTDVTRSFIYTVDENDKVTCCAETVEAAPDSLWEYGCTIFTTEWK